VVVCVPQISERCMLPALQELIDQYPFIIFNFHRPCGYPNIIVDEKGRKKRLYHTYQTPYEALKNIKEGEKFLKPNLSFEKLDKIAYKYSDNEFAQILRNEEKNCLI